MWITAVNRSKYTVSILPPDKWYIQTTSSSPPPHHHPHYHFDNRSYHDHDHHHTHDYYYENDHHHLHANDSNDSSSSISGSSSRSSNNDLSNSITRNYTSRRNITTKEGGREETEGRGNRNHSAYSKNSLRYDDHDEHHRYDDVASYDIDDAHLIKSLLRNKRIIFVGDSLSR